MTADTTGAAENTSAADGATTAAPKSSPKIPSKASSNNGKAAMGKAATLARLLERVAAGDRAAFEKLYRRTAASVYALVRRLLPDEAASAAVTEEVYVRVWAGAHAYERTRHSAEHWLLNLTHRCAVERIRTAGPAPAVAPEASLLPSLAGASAVHAISLLTPEQAEALELSYLGGRTHAESARELGVDQATFRLRVGTALSRLRQGMEADAGNLRGSGADLRQDPR